MFPHLMTSFARSPFETSLFQHVTKITQLFRHLYPTLPSKLTPNSFCASTANSIGSSLNTSLQNPLTIMLIASSRLSPRELAVEELILADLARAGFVLDGRRSCSSLRCTATCAPRTGRPAASNRTGCNCGRSRRPLDESSPGRGSVLARCPRDALADDGAAGVLPEVNHLRAGVGLLAWPLVRATE